MRKELPTVEYLRKTIRYDAETGRMYWLKRTKEQFSPKTLGVAKRVKYWNTKFAGKETALYTDGQGYPRCKVNRVAYGAHRIAWVLYYGEWPDKQIDHINGNIKDNRIVNLRCVNMVENARNKKRPYTNKSGFIGVHWDKKASKWRAAIGVKRKKIILGYYDDIKEAASARSAAEKKYNFHPNHGR